MPKVTNVRDKLGNRYADEYCYFFDDDVPGGVTIMRPEAIRHGERLLANHNLASLIPEDRRTYQSLVTMGDKLIEENGDLQVELDRLTKEIGIAKIYRDDDSAGYKRLLDKKVKVDNLLELEIAHTRRLEKRLEGLTDPFGDPLYLREFNLLKYIVDMPWYKRLAAVFVGFDGSNHEDYDE